MTVKIITPLDTQPARDHYKGGDAVTDIMLWLDPRERTCGVQDWRGDYANIDYWHGYILHDSIVFNPDQEPEYPDPKPLWEYLESEDGQNLLNAVCDGWQLMWDGNNNWGITHDEALDAWDGLIEYIRDGLPSTAWTVWITGDWFNGNEGLSGTETDEQVREFADAFQVQADADNQILDEDIYDYLITKRNELKEQKQ